ncbi:SDR family NAD(P)-dependent oxidoreductase [Streptomyces sp. NPDC046261]|uniref:SDR family NAD(P)-dependent oxidoreductase n=1 Tax=Streptomyces sp. NPDC046261 TaxID=3157200 RepID=UPI0033ED872B
MADHASLRGGPLPEDVTHPVDATAWGAARTLANECPRLTGRRVSLRRSSDVRQDARRLAHELLRPTAEDEIVLTAHGRFIPRLRPHPTPTRPASGTSCSLRLYDPGLSYRLVWQEETLPDRPGPGEVLVEVRATALNYRDVVRILGLLPSEMFEGEIDEVSVGAECAGVVLAAGPGVSGFTPGDRVMGIAGDAFAQRTLMVPGKMWRVADDVTFAEAAAFPVAVVTVQYALGELARLQPGETVLVHGAAGGVGMAAITYAWLKGAHVIATAGNDVKRAFLRSCGVEYVLDSRSLDFAERIRELTHGRGVDVVLNSLAGEAMARSLELLRPGGRFLELGKRDFYENKPVLLRPFAKNIAFFGVDINHTPRDPALLSRIHEHVARLSEQVRLTMPYTAFPAARVQEAFQFLQHSRHIGKVVVTHDPLDEPPLVEQRAAAPRLDPWGSYLVTGGTGGFGAATACWLAGLGARHLVLVSRRGAQAPEAAEVLERLTASGVRADIRGVDVTDEAALRALLDDLEADGRPLRGVVHAAMHLDDGPLDELTDDRIEAVLAPKVAGAHLLDALVRERGADVDLFLLHSSGAATIGNVTQAPYAGANLYLEALARQRRRRGAAGTAIAWGAIADTGFVARNDLGATVENLGFKPMTAREAFAAATDLTGSATDVATVACADWSRLSTFLPLVASPRLQEMVPAPGADGMRPEDMATRLAALSPDEALSLIKRTLTELFADMLHVEADRLEPDRRLDEYGMDSLMATQVLVTINQRYGIAVPPMDVLRSNGTIDDLARILYLRLGVGTPAPAPPER